MNLALDAIVLALNVCSMLACGGYRRSEMTAVGPAKQSRLPFVRLDRPSAAFGGRFTVSFISSSHFDSIPRCKAIAGEYVHSIRMLDILCALIVAVACDTINSYGAQTFKEPTM